MKAQEYTPNNHVEILIVEDSPTQADQLKHILEGHGYGVSVAANGKQALARMDQQRPALVISDIVMPEMDGYELCRTIKSNDQLRDIPVILLTSLSEPSDIVRGLLCAADNFVTKPYDEKYLLSRVEYILINRELRKHEGSQLGVEIFFAGQKHSITSERLQILDLLFSTYETAVQKNLELVKVQNELKAFNEQLEQKVNERTADLRAEIAERERAEEVVQESEERFRLVVESAPNAMVMVDQHGKIVLVNSKVEEYFGYTRNELIGESIELLVPQRYREKHRNYETMFMTNPAVRPMTGRELSAQRKDGTEFPVEIGLNPVATKEGTMVLCSVVDITERKRAEQILREREQRLSSIYDTVGDVIFHLAVEPKGRYRFISVNKAFVTTTGIDAAHVVGKLINEIIPEPSLSLVLGKYKEAIREKKIVRWEETSDYPTGRLTGEVSVAPVFDDAGNCTHLVGAVHDITERKQAEEALVNAEKRYRTTLDHMLEGCQIIGFDWRYLYINDVAAKQGRRTKKELLGHTMIEIYPGIEHSQMFSELRRCMEEHVPHRMENEFTFPDGSRGWFHLSMEPVPEGVFILSEDITKEKQLDEELKKHREHLEELVIERTAQLEAANKELESFSYSVSHDLRAPLRHIDGFVELFSKSFPGKLDEKSHRYLNIISESAKKMGKLIDDLLVFSRMGRTELQKTQLDCNKLIQDIVNAVKAGTQERIIHWRINNLPEIQADPSMMRQVWLNLITNAVKYTGQRKEAIIEVGHQVEDDENIFFIRDNGAGFDMKYADKLFGVFQRLHRAEDFEGTGVGLANVRRIINRHGGKTWAEGEVDKGARFYFSLPRVAKNKN